MKRLLTLLLISLATVALAQDLNDAPVTPAFSPVTWDRLVNASDEPENWLTYSGTQNSQRYTRLDQVDISNVTDLELKWSYQIPVIDRAETTPLVVDGIMFITESPSNVVAVDAVTGRQYWRYDYELPEDLRICCGRNNRGVAILGETLYMSTLDAHLVAIDARTGNLRWDTEVADYAKGYSKTAAPIIVKDMVVTGIAGGEFGIRGFIDAYDAATGERRWRTYTVAGPGDPNVSSWADDSWKIGGAPTWITGSYDADLNLVYWGTGNPAPDYNGDVRLGDNLYSDSALALNGDTGEIEWHFQFTPHDEHDWDAIQIPILADIQFQGRQRKVMLWANRNAFFYTIDRATGEFLLGTPFAKQTWASGLDSKGRPIVLPGVSPTYEGVLVSPSIGGGTNWYSPAYSPKTELFYVNSYDGEHKYIKRDEEYEEGQRFTGGGFESVQPIDNYYSAIRAIDPGNGEIKWEFPIQPRSSAGIMATSGGLLFSGSVDGYFYALDANNGRELWHISLGARVHSAPMSFAVDGKQFISVAAGNVVYTFGLKE
ncbi:MAG: PQQ-dependent dehydrogenase, methanol/ethanol family [Gammaproteobacteria bacterium]|nr:PQQ-dependent dehydrogenase, methanol/ethanol family [Gammaproteobacteria bacterium]